MRFMDDIVKQAMAKWPNVPACYGWLGLDSRGHWYLRDDVAQAHGAFASGEPLAKGSLVQLERLVDFIGRNYGADAAGRWFFQNGPQRVFVELETTPWVWRVAEHAHAHGRDDAGTLHSHTGQPARLLATLTDEDGRLYVQTDLGMGLVHTQDVVLAAEWLEQGRWPMPDAVLASSLPARFGYVLSPQAGPRGDASP